MDSANHRSLRRKLGLFSVTNIVVANMIGAGIFTTSGLLLQDLEHPLIMIGLWILGGVIALAGALCYGEIGANIPKAGGEYTYLSALYHPLLGFLSGWVSFIAGFSAPIAASSIGFSEYLSRALPALFENSFASPQASKNIVSIGIILVFTAVHLRGISFGSKVQNYLTVLKIAILAGLVVFGFTLGQGSVAHFRIQSAPELNSRLLLNAGLALMWIMFAYSGWNASSYIGAEIKKPEKNLFLSLILGTTLVMLLYTLVNVLFVYAIPPNDMKGVISVGGLAVNNLFGQSMDNLFSMMIAVALFSSISAFIILGPRVYYAMAQNGHFFRFASKINPVTKAPSLSILFQAGVSIVIILSGTFEQILTYIGFSLGIFPILVALAVFKMRKKGLSKIKLKGHPYAALFYIFAAVAILTLTFIERPVESLIAIGVLLSGIPFYYYFLRNRKQEVIRNDAK